MRVRREIADFCLKVKTYQSVVRIAEKKIRLANIKEQAEYEKRKKEFNL